MAVTLPIVSRLQSLFAHLEPGVVEPGVVLVVFVLGVVVGCSGAAVEPLARKRTTT